MSVSLTKPLLFTVESGNSKYRVNLVTPDADSAILRFLEVVDSNENTRIRRDETVMARKTPKGTYLHPEWR